MRAARLSLLLSPVVGFCSYRNQDLVHRDIEEIPERVKVVYRRKALSPLPLVDRLGLFKSEVLLKVPDGQSPFDTETPDVVPGRDQVDHGVLH